MGDEKVEHVDGQVGIGFHCLLQAVVKQTLDVGLLRKATTEGEQDVGNERRGCSLPSFSLRRRLSETVNGLWSKKKNAKRKKRRKTNPFLFLVYESMYLEDQSNNGAHP